MAALAEKKGHRYLLDALAAAPDASDSRSTWWATASCARDLEARARELGLAERVRFHGELPKEEVARLMRDADLFVLPSLHETCRWC